MNLRNFDSVSDVDAYAKETGRKLVVFEGTVYDIIGYHHPGGNDQIEPFIGKEIDEPFEE